MIMPLQEWGAPSRRRAAKFLLAVCGLAGCTSRPDLASVPIEPPGGLSRTDERTFSITDSTGIARLTKPATRPIWASNASRTAVPVDPFAEFETAAPRQRTPVQPVSHLDDLDDDATRSTTTTTVGVARAKDHRLPPAAPLGATNPFAPANRQPADATIVTTRTAAKPAADTAQATTLVSRQVPATTPMPTFLNAPPSRVAGDVPNQEMIVDSTVLPRRSEWRTEVRPRLADGGRSDYAITPRRPFSIQEENDEGSSSASANVPVTVSPSFRTAPLPPTAEPPQPSSVGQVLPTDPFLGLSSPALAAPPQPVSPAADGNR
jgi:hypothetical protein